MSVNARCRCGQALKPGRGVEWVHICTGSPECPGRDGGIATPIEAGK